MTTIIKIEADGIGHELESFMFDILKKLQIKAANQNATLALGIENTNFYKIYDDMRSKKDE